MINPVDTIELENVTVNIYPEGDSMQSPREWDNLGTMVCFHRNYNLGDEKHGFYSPEDFTEFLQENKSKLIALPLYLYDHSGISMSCELTYPFNDLWDSGQVGYIFVTYETLQKEYHWKNITKARKAKIIQYLKQEVETYDQYLTGDVYGFATVCNHCGEELDSCWGFYGHDWKENGLLEYAEDSTCNCLEEAKQQENNLQLALSY
jgi:hypothetical protein